MVKNSQASYGANDADLEIDTLIGASTEIIGELRFRGALHMEGVIDGKLQALDEQGAAIVSGTVNGQVIAPQVIVSGTVDGDIHASEQLQLKAGAVVTGRVVCRTIGMELNASLNGKLNVDPKLIAPTITKPA